MSGASTITKMLWIVMENHDYSAIVGSSAAPYENQIANACGLATNYHAITHPSLPNYIAMTSGSTQGITDDNPPSSHPLNVSSIFGQLSSVKSYEESMPSNCQLTNSGLYAVKHNPEAYYTPVRTRCGADNVPMGTPTSGNLRNDIAAGLPRFSFLTPNLCDDMHDCSVATGDAWLQSWVPQLIAGPDYQAGRLAIVITFDENGGTSGNQVYTAVISPFTTPGTRSATSFTHYSLLRTAEEILGVPLLGGAAGASSMRSAFNLG
jgi:phosphatidylinositol-3-phosphatase